MIRTVNVVLDTYSGVICMVLIWWLAAKDRRKIRSNRCFLYVCLGNVGMILGDLTNWTCEGFAHPWNPFLLKAGSWMYYFCSLPMLFFYTKYVEEYLSERTEVPRYAGKAVALVCILFFIGLAVTPFTGFYYRITPENRYARGDYFYVSQIFPGIIYALDLYLIWRHRGAVKWKETVMFMSYVACPLAAMAVQANFYGIALINTAITFSLILIYLGIQWNRELLIRQQETELAKAQIRVLMSQIRPHFLYNALAVIRQLCDVDPPRAKQAVTDFAGFLRANMDSLTDMGLIPFDRELKHVEHYLNLEEQRFLGRLKVVYDIEARGFFLPPLTLQPIVENAVRHGLLKKEEGGTVTISSRETDTAYQVVVADDGVGFPAERLWEDRADGSGHVGLWNVRARLETMEAGTLSVQSEPGRGTRVVIEIQKEVKR